MMAPEPGTGHTREEEERWNGNGMERRVDGGKNPAEREGKIAALEFESQPRAVTHHQALASPN